MSTSITEYHINIDGRTMTPAQLYRFAKGLVIAEQNPAPQNDPDLYRQFIIAHRQIRKLQRKLRKAAGREKRLVNHLFGHSHSQFVYATAQIRDARIEGQRYRHRNEMCLTCYKPIRECGGVK